VYVCASATAAVVVLAVTVIVIIIIVVVVVVVVLQSTGIASVGCAPRFCARESTEYHALVARRSTSFRRSLVRARRK